MWEMLQAETAAQQPVTRPGHAGPTENGHVRDATPESSDGADSPTRRALALPPTAMDQAVARRRHEEEMSAIAQALRPAASDLIKRLEGAPRDEIDEAILKTIVRPAVANRNRDLGAVNDPQLPATADMDILSRLRGSGPMQRIFDLPGVTDVYVDGREPVYYDRNGVRVVDGLIMSEDDIAYFVQRCLLEQGSGQTWGAYNPTVRIRTDLLRIIAHHHTVVPAGSTLSIRVRPPDPLTTEDLIRNGMFSRPTWDMIYGLFQANLCGIIGGDVGSGKTTLTQALAQNLPYWNRLVTIESEAEFQLKRDFYVQMEELATNADGEHGYSMHDLIRDTRRMGADNVIVGEVLEGEALDMLGVMKMGRAGSLCTLHARTPLDALERLETMCLENPKGMRLEAVRPAIKHSISFIVIVQKMATVGEDGKPRWKRAITDVAELEGLTPEGYVVKSILRWEDGELRWTGNGFSTITQNKLTRAGIAPFDFTPYRRTSDAVIPGRTE